MAISRVQKKTGSRSGAGTDLAITMDSTPIAGNLLVLGIGTLNGSQLTAADSISQTNVSWSRRLTQSWSASDGEGTLQVGRLDVWEGTVSASASASLTVTVTVSGKSAVASVFEITGQHASSPFDVSASETDTNLAITQPDTNVTASTAENEEYAWGVIATNEGTGATYSDNGGQATFVEQTNLTTEIALLTFEGLNEAIGTKQGKGTSASHATNWGYAGAIVTYKQASAATTAPTRNLMGVGT